MKGSRVVLVLAAIVLILGAATIRAQDGYARSIVKVVSPGRATVVCDTDVFTFQTDDCLVVTFEKLSAAHVKLTVKRLTGRYAVEELFVNWGCYSPVMLVLDSYGGDSFILNTETGYAEK